MYGQKNHRRIRALLYIMTDRAKPATTHNLGPTASQSVLLLDPRSRCCHSVGRSSPITQLRRCAQRKMNPASPLYSAPVLWPLPRTQYMCTNTHTNMENMSRSTSILWLWVTQSFSCVTPHLELQQWAGQKLLEGKILYKYEGMTSQKQMITHICHIYKKRNSLQTIQHVSKWL